MACDTSALLEQAKCIITCIPPGMMPAASLAALCNISGFSVGPDGFVTINLLKTTGFAWLTISDASGVTAPVAAELYHEVNTGVGGGGISGGVSLDFRTDSATVDRQLQIRMGSFWTDPADATRTSHMRIFTVANAVTAEAIRIANDNILVTQTWNNALADFTALKLAVTATATLSATTSFLIDGQIDGVSRFTVNQNGTVRSARRTADISGATFQTFKRGNAGGATNPISAGSTIGAFDFLAWDGTSESTVAFLRDVSVEAGDFSNTAHGSKLVMAVAAIGATALTTCAEISAVSLNVQNGCAYYLNSAPLFNPLSVYASGTAYTLTATSAAVDFGTTDPIITITQPGTYAIRAQVRIAVNAATFAATRTLTVKLRRTNNTPADLTDAVTPFLVPIMTTLSQTLCVIQLPEVFYTTANSTDTIQLFGDISVLPSAGTITVNQASIVAVRLS